MYTKIVLHIDFNSYFASVEQQDNPAWRNLPVGVCEHLGGIIIAPSVEAKRWGIKTGTPVWEARKIFPKIILTKTNPDRYRFYTGKFLKLLKEYSNRVELYSIDEAFVDVTKFCYIQKKEDDKWVFAEPYVEAARIAREIKSRIKDEVGEWLRVSVGIGWNKLTAKIASDRQKPDGLTVFRPEDKNWLLQNIGLMEIPGIGKRQMKNLQNLGIETLVDLHNYPKVNLIARFGLMGWHLWNMGQLENTFNEYVLNESEKEGFLENGARTNSKIKSMGHMYTLPKEFRKAGAILPMLSRLSSMVGVRLRKAGLAGGVIVVWVKTTSEEAFGASKRLEVVINDDKEIFLAAKNLLSSVKPGFEGLSPVLVAVTLAGLRGATKESSLWRYWNKRQGLMKAQDKINDRYGVGVLQSAESFLAGNAIRESVGFGRIKEIYS